MTTAFAKSVGVNDGDCALGVFHGETDYNDHSDSTARLVKSGGKDGDLQRHQVGHLLTYCKRNTLNRSENLGWEGGGGCFGGTLGGGLQRWRRRRRGPGGLRRAGILLAGASLFMALGAEICGSTRKLPCGHLYSLSILV